MLRTLHPNIRIRIYTTFLSKIGGSTVFPFMAIYFTREFNASVAGILVLIQIIAQFAAGLYGGYLADLLGRKKIMVVGEFMKVAGFIGMFAVNSPLFISPTITFLMMLLTNVASGLISPAAEAMLIDLSTKETRAFMYSINYWAVNLSVMIGFIAGGWFFEHHFFQLIGVLIGMGLLTLCMTAFFIKDTYQVQVKGTSGQYGVKPLIKSYEIVMKDWTFMAFSLGGVAILALEFQRNNFISVRLKDEIIPRTVHFFNVFSFDLDGIKLLSLLTVINTLMIILFTGIAAKWIREKREEPIMYAGFTLFGIGFSILAFSTSIPVLFLAVVILSVGELLYVPTRQSMLAEIVDDSKRGAYMAMNGLVVQVAKMMGALGLMIGTSLGGVVMALAFLLLTFVGIVMSRVALLKTNRQLKKALS